MVAAFGSAASLYREWRKERRERDGQEANKRLKSLVDYSGPEIQGEYDREFRRLGEFFSRGDRTPTDSLLGFDFINGIDRCWTNCTTAAISRSATDRYQHIERSQRQRCTEKPCPSESCSPLPFFVIRESKHALCSWSTSTALDAGRSDSISFTARSKFRNHCPLSESGLGRGRRSSDSVAFE